MASENRIEHDRGKKESRQQLAALREKWPLAFPINEQDVRPLANNVAREIAAAMGWSHGYGLGVLSSWKLASVYCHAVLCHEHRIALDGGVAEPVEPEAKALAAKRLETLAARKATKEAKQAAKVAPAEVVKEALAPPPFTPLPRAAPEDLRARVRASLLRRSA